MKGNIVVIRKKTLIYIICYILVVVCLILCLSNATVITTLGKVAVKKTPIYNVERSDNKIGISFDAAWGADKTLSILDILDKCDIKATFFLVGFWVDKYCDIVREIDKRGHTIGTHSNTHPNMSKLSVVQMTQELQTSMDKITAITGKQVTIFRPPFGDYDDRLIDVCKQLKLSVIQWDVDSLDWKKLSATDITARIVSRTRSGSIILCHNNSDHIVEALPITIKQLQAKGFIFEPIDKIIYYENFYIDHTGKQILNKN